MKENLKSQNEKYEIMRLNSIKSITEKKKKKKKMKKKNK